MKYKSLAGALFLFLITVISIPAQTHNSGPRIPVIKAGILNKKAVSLPDPVVSSSLIDIAASGGVTVKVVVDMEGKVISARAISGHPLLRKPAEEAALKARFHPTMADGPAIRVSGFLVYEFSSFHFVASKKPITVTAGMVAREWSGRGAPLFLKKPVYPAAALAVNAGGRVKVAVTVDEKGKVISVKILSGHLLLRHASLAAAKRSRFRPVFISGKPVKVYGVIVYNFING